MVTAGLPDGDLSGIVKSARGNNLARFCFWEPLLLRRQGQPRRYKRGREILLRGLAMMPKNQRDAIISEKI